MDEKERVRLIIRMSQVRNLRKIREDGARCIDPAGLGPEVRRSWGKNLKEQERLLRDLDREEVESVTSEIFEHPEDADLIFTPSELDFLTNYGKQYAPTPVPPFMRPFMAPDGSGVAFERVQTIADLRTLKDGFRLEEEE